VLVREGDVVIVVDPGMVAKRSVILDPLAAARRRPGRGHRRGPQPPPPGPHPERRALRGGAGPRLPGDLHRRRVGGDGGPRASSCRPRCGCSRRRGTRRRTSRRWCDTRLGLVVCTHLWWSAEGPAEDPFAPDRRCCGPRASASSPWSRRSSSPATAPAFVPDERHPPLTRLRHSSRCPPPCPTATRRPPTARCPPRRWSRRCTPVRRLPARAVLHDALRVLRLQHVHLPELGDGVSRTTYADRSCASSRSPGRCWGPGPLRAGLHRLRRRRHADAAARRRPRPDAGRGRRPVRAGARCRGHDRGEPRLRDAAVAGRAAVRRLHPDQLRDAVGGPARPRDAGPHAHPGPGRRGGALGACRPASSR
jgi:hypothetical protein